MILLSHITLSLLLLAALAGCALPGMIATNTSADVLSQKLGKPTETRANPAGGEYWDYVYGPEGTETWRFAIDGSRMVRSKEQILTHERLHKVVPGTTTQAQVRELLGKPSGIYELRMGPTWDWRIDMPPTKGHFIVNFDRNGVATSIGVLMDMIMDDGRGDR
jgi:hypothetical protein